MNDNVKKNAAGLLHRLANLDNGLRSRLELAAIDFDTNTLKSLGLDPKVSHYFSHYSAFFTWRAFAGAER
jgi:hypothetical protein